MLFINSFSVFVSRRRSSIKSSLIILAGGLPCPYPVWTRRDCPYTQREALYQLKMPEKRQRKEVSLEPQDQGVIAVEGDLQEGDAHLASMRADAMSVKATQAALGMFCVRKPLEPGNWASTRSAKTKSFYTDVVFNPKVKEHVEALGFSIDNPWDAETTEKLFAFFDSFYSDMDTTKFQNLMQANKNVSIASLFKPNPYSAKEQKVGKYIYTHPHGNAGADTSKITFLREFTKATQSFALRTADPEEADEFINNEAIASFCRVKAGDKVGETTVQHMKALYAAWYIIGISLVCAATEDQLGSKDDWKKARISVRKNAPQEFPQLDEKTGKITKPDDLELLHGFAKQLLRDTMWQSISDACPFSVAPDVDADISTSTPPYSTVVRRNLYRFYLKEDFKTSKEPDASSSYLKKRLYQVSRDSGLQVNPVRIFDVSGDTPKNCSFFSSRISRKSLVAAGLTFSTYIGPKVGVKLEVADALCVAGELEPVSELESGPSFNPENAASMLLAATMSGKRSRDEASDEEDGNPAKRLAAASGV